MIEGRAAQPTPIDIALPFISSSIKLPYLMQSSSPSSKPSVDTTFPKPQLIQAKISKIGNLDFDADQRSI